MNPITWIVGVYQFGLDEISKMLSLASKHIRLVILVIFISLGCSLGAYAFTVDDLKAEQDEKNQEISQKIDKLGEKLEFKIDELKNILILKGDK